MENIPTSPAEYENKIVEIKEGDIKEFFNQGTVDVALESDNTLTFSKPYSGDVTAKFIAIGEYDDVKHIVFLQVKKIRRLSYFFMLTIIATLTHYF
jgi:hypothetical protein